MSSGDIFPIEISDSHLQSSLTIQELTLTLTIYWNGINRTFAYEKTSDCALLVWRCWYGFADYGEHLIWISKGICLQSCQFSLKAFCLLISNSYGYSIHFCLPSAKPKFENTTSYAPRPWAASGSTKSVKSVEKVCQLNAYLSNKEICNDYNTQEVCPRDNCCMGARDENLQPTVLWSASQVRL